ncbi:hypothetical protein Y032_0037g3439 [Ancylostoma ceylanicum]|uniref:Major facilitator superfamily (MFS) profile domain-containing protein n=1 Tax=Ancylostoma ceylanicum TaxID=53326 RepID=A0A016UKB7_9BILA|nr:hypothetical protein Y032_0037g3439 [Ancylostoma ceylanicum]
MVSSSLNAPFRSSTMQLTPRRHELLSVYLLGAGTLFMYLGYITQAFIAESVIHTVSKRYPGTISEFAGYYGQAFHYSAFAVSSLITPSIQHYLSSKWVLTVASVLFALYYLGFIHVTSIYFYLSQGLMGIGYSFYNNGEGAYLSEHSSRRTIESNTGIETAVGHSSMFVGGAALALIFYMLAPNTPGVRQTSLEFTDTQILWIYGTFFGLNVISVVIFACLPTKQYDSIASNAKDTMPSLKQQMVQFKSAVVDMNMLLLAPFFGYMGLITSFLMGVYPTTLAFTAAFSGDLYIIAIYSLSMGAAEIFGGVFLRRLIKKCQHWGLVVTITTHFLAISAVLTLVQLSVPEMATIEPTASPSMFIKPSRLVVIIIGFLLGLGDFTITMGRAVICQVAVPDSRMQVFSMSRLYQCVSSCIVLFLTPFLTITYWTIVLATGLIIGATTFAVVARRTAHHRKNLVAPHSHDKLTKSETA